MLFPVKYTKAIAFTHGIKLGCGHHMTSEGLFTRWFKIAYSTLRSGSSKFAPIGGLDWNIKHSSATLQEWTTGSSSHRCIPDHLGLHSQDTYELSAFSAIFLPHLTSDEMKPWRLNSLPVLSSFSHSWALHAVPCCCVPAHPPTL